MTFCKDIPWVVVVGSCEVEFEFRQIKDSPIRTHSTVIITRPHILLPNSSNFGQLANFRNNFDSISTLFSLPWSMNMLNCFMKFWQFLPSSCFSCGWAFPYMKHSLIFWIYFSCSCSNLMNMMRSSKVQAERFQTGGYLWCLKTADLFISNCKNCSLILYLSSDLSDTKNSKRYCISRQMRL